MSWQPPQIAVTVFLPGPSGKSWACAHKTVPSKAAEIAEIIDWRDMNSSPQWPVARAATMKCCDRDAALRADPLTGVSLASRDQRRKPVTARDPLTNSRS
jgi:hypothetical protein